MKVRSVIPIAFFVTLVLSGCSGGDYNGTAVGGGTSTGTGAVSLTPTAISNSADGASAASFILQSKELLTTSTNLFKNLGFIAQSQMVSAASGTGSGVCTDYGTYDYTRTYNTSGTYTIFFTFKLCRENDFQYDGMYTAIGTQGLFTGRIAGLKILNFKSNYTTLIGSLVGTSLSYRMEGSGDAANGSYTFTANGGMQAFDYYSLGQHTMTFTALVSSFSVTTDGATNIRDTTMTANGKYSARRLTTTTAITYSNFTVNAQKQLLTGIEDVSLAGRIVADLTPTAGFEGVFDVATVTPVRTALTPYPPTTTQGTLTTNSTATIQYGAVNTIDVTAAGGGAVTFAKEFMLLRQEDFYAMEQQLPIISGMTGTATGSIMSISALSTGPGTTALSCYTDVHVKYFTQTSPAVTDTKLWMVDWKTPISGNCVPTAAIPYQQATSSTGVPTDPCDVGLDINGSATDITSGGVEHFLAAAFPTGYYVLSINNWNCSTAVSNDATILIGDQLFGPYHCSYTAADGDGTNPGAWCRLVDIRVNAGGVIDVLTPDATLTPWHP